MSEKEVVKSDSKWILKSKSVWFGLIVALASFYSPAAEFVKENPEAVAKAFGVLVIILRYVTKDKVVLK